MYHNIIVHIKSVPNTITDKKPALIKARHS